MAFRSVHGFRGIPSIDGFALAAKGIFMYHYSLVFPRQVTEKATYYSRANWSKNPRMNDWAEESYTRLRWPYRIHHVFKHPSWLQRFDGQHPEQIEALRADLVAGRTTEIMRQTADIDALLDTRWYGIGRAILKAAGPMYDRSIRLRRRTRRILRRLLPSP